MKGIADTSGVLNTVGPKTVVVQQNDGSHLSISYDKCVIAAGFKSGEVAAKAGIGTGHGLLSVPLPVEPKLVINIRIFIVLFLHLQNSCIVQKTICLLCTLP